MLNKLDELTYYDQRNQYIEERLKKPNGKEHLESDINTVPSEIRNDEDLYADLKQKVTGSLVPRDDAADGGVLIWNTGIAEVELPSKFHEQAVRDTEKALARESSLVQQEVNNSALPSNFSTDFFRHRTEFLTELKNLSKGMSWVLRFSGYYIHFLCR